MLWSQWPLEFLLDTVRVTVGEMQRERFLIEGFMFNAVSPEFLFLLSTGSHFGGCSLRPWRLFHKGVVPGSEVRYQTYQALLFQY